jgi:hypothetical protein
MNNTISTKSFLKVLEKVGYPNPSIVLIANAVSYDLDGFLYGLRALIGDNGVKDFCDDAIYKLTGDEGLKIDLDGPSGDEFVYIHIYPIYYDEDESENDIICNSGWGKSKILNTDEDGKEEYLTIEEVIENTDMGGWAELDELIDHIKAQAYNKIYNNCGFGVWWQ